MREIKFRVWDIENKCFYKPTYKAYDGKLHDISITLNGIVMERTLESCASMLNDQNYVLQQFTGLKDKNGVEIYENDIVNHDGYISVVSWGKKAHGFKLKTDTSIREKWGKVKYYSLPSSKNIEVIGNIYQNPELL